jgi:cytochrome c551/c552
MHPDDDTPPPRPRWLGWALIAFGLLMALGMLNLGVRMVLSAKPPQADTPEPSSAATPVAGVAEVPQTSSLAGQTLVQASDCLRCHGMDRRYVGPSFRQIADRYREQPDAADYLARKIREGSVGVWGRTVMPRHPQVTEAQSSDMARWLLSLPPAQPLAPQ